MFVQFLGFIIVDFVIIVFVVAVAFSNIDTDSNTAIISVFGLAIYVAYTYTTKSTFV